MPGMRCPRAARSRCAPRTCAPATRRWSATRACRSGNTCWWRSRTPAAASRPRSSTRSSTPSTPPRTSARAPGSGCRRSTASSSRPAGESLWRRGAGSGRDARQGPTFRIFLPRYVPAADDVRPPQLPESTASAIAIAAADEMRSAAADLTGEGTILLVEDEEGLRALNARGLTSRGFTVIEAGNGVEALEELEKQGGSVDLVVSDVVVPEMDGPTLLKELKKRNPDIQVLFVSGYAEDAFDKSLPAHHQFNFLAKPFTLKQLVTAVKETMAS